MTCVRKKMACNLCEISKDLSTQTFDLFVVDSLIAPRSIIQFGDDDDLHARAHLRAHNDYKFAHAPATAVVATYAKAQANVADGGGGGGGGASRARCARAQIDGIAPPERGRPTSPVAFNVSSIARYAGAVQRARHEHRRCLFCHILI